MELTHHAYYIEGPLSAFGAYKDKVVPFYARQYERFGIDEARELQGIASLKNYESGIFLLGIVSLTSEAQQAMLKLFEEPQEGTQFVLLVPHGMLLPTLRSRMLEYPEKLNGPGDVRDAKKFLGLAGKERSAFIAKLLKDDLPAGKADEGARERVRDFVNALEAELYVRPRRSNMLQARQALEDIAMVRQYLGDRSPSLKMLLDHLALALPTH